MSWHSDQEIRCDGCARAYRLDNTKKTLVAYNWESVRDDADDYWDFCSACRGSKCYEDCKRYKG